jgi:hypothetical protein
MGLQGLSNLNKWTTTEKNGKVREMKVKFYSLLYFANDTIQPCSSYWNASSFGASYVSYSMIHCSTIKTFRASYKSIIGNIDAYHKKVNKLAINPFTSELDYNTLLSV